MKRKSGAKIEKGISYLKRRLTKPPKKTYWNGEETPAVKVRVVVGAARDGDPPAAWWRKIVGQVRDAVKVTYHGESFYLDNQTGLGWSKVTMGRGSPAWGHSSLPNNSLEIP